MARMMDNMTNKTSDMGDEIRQRFDMLRGKEQDGSISDSERGELQDLRSRMGM